MNKEKIEELASNITHEYTHVAECDLEECIIQHLTSALNDRWVKVEYGLPINEKEEPEYSITVKVLAENVEINGWYDYALQKWFTQKSGFYISNVTHWQPLPSKPIE